MCASTASASTTTDPSGVSAGTALSWTPADASVLVSWGMNLVLFGSFYSLSMLVSRGMHLLFFGSFYSLSLHGVSTVNIEYSCAESKVLIKSPVCGVTGCYGQLASSDSQIALHLGHFYAF